MNLDLENLLERTKRNNLQELNLNNLNVSGKRAELVADSISSMTNLRSLILGYNPGVCSSLFTSSLKKLTQLRKLDLEGILIDPSEGNESELVDCISCLTNLENLNLLVRTSQPSEDCLLDLAMSVRKLRNMEHLAISSLGIDRWVSALPIKTLRLRIDDENNTLKYLKAFENLTELHVCNAGALSVEHWASLEPITSLRKLKIEQHISSAGFLRYLTQLTSLDLHGCRLVEEDLNSKLLLSGLRNLEEISLNGFHQAIIPNSVLFCGLTGFTHISLNNFTTNVQTTQYLNDFLCKQSGLVSIRLVSIHDMKLPPSFAEHLTLSRLKVLDLSQNMLKDYCLNLGPALSQLSELSILNLSGNMIESVHFIDFESLTNLYNLNLSGNGISNIPNSLKKLCLLQSLDLHGNLLQKDSAEILIDCLDQLTLLTYLDVSRNKIGEEGIDMLKSKINERKDHVDFNHGYNNECGVVGCKQVGIYHCKTCSLKDSFPLYCGNHVGLSGMSSWSQYCPKHSHFWNPPDCQVL